MGSCVSFAFKCSKASCAPGGKGPPFHVASFFVNSVSLPAIPAYSRMNCRK